MYPHAGELMRRLLDHGTIPQRAAEGRLYLDGVKPPDELLAEARARRDDLRELLAATCVDCGAPLPAGNLYRCTECVAEAYREAGT